MSDGRTWGTIIGGVVGYFTGGIGFAAGAAIGGAVGGLLEPKQHTETNRIDDIKVSLSKYGDGIPETWGNNIPSATCVWSTYIIELPEKQSGGKGGGVENTNYRQFIQSMWCLGRTPPPGSTVVIRKVWINGKLNYDASSGLSMGQALATEENPWASIVLLPGFDGQLPVPMVETYEGIGNVPAFTGRICIFIFGLECPGGRVPQLQFELCINATTQIVDATLTTFNPSYLASVACIDDAAAITMLYGPGWNNDYDEYGVEVRRISPDGQQIVESQYTALSNGIAARGHSDEPCFVLNGAEGADTLDYYNATGFGGTYTFPIDVNSLFAVYSKLGNRFAVGWKFLITDGPYVFDSASSVPRDMALGVLVGDVGLTEDFIYVMHSGKINKYTLEDLSFVAEVCDVPNYTSTESLMHVVSDTEIYVLDEVLNKVYLVYEGDLIERFNCDSVFSVRYGAVFHVFGGVLIAGDGSGGDSMSRLDSSRRELVPTSSSVSELIESVCDRVGLEGKTDISTIDDSMWGYTFNKSPASARGIVTPLMTYSALGVVEEDGLLRFFRREDKAFVATIGYDELGFSEDGSEPGDPFPVVHANAQELPRSLTLSYSDPSFDYQVSTVRALMQTSDSVLDLNETLDMAMDGARAATIARRLLLERWIAQNTRTAAISRKFAYLSAGDVIRVEYPRNVLNDWMTSKITDTGARIEIECFPSDSDLIIQTVPGPGSFQAQQIQPLAPPTRLVIADSPILRDEDSNAGVYAVMAGYFPGWRGAELFAGDEETSMSSRGTVSNEATIGYAETALGNFPYGTVDETNLLTVDVGHHELSNITRDVLLGGTSNTALVGGHGRWEVIKFQRVDDLGSGRYILSGLMRGLKGTEWARGLHAAGDAFVLMGTAGTLRPNFDVGSIGQTKAYKAVSVGRSFESAVTQTQESTGEGLRPLSPVRLRKSITSNDITLTWDRRTRMSESALTGILPLGESTEAYEVEIYSSGAFTTVKRVIQAFSGRTATYTSAQQITDFGTNQTTLYVRVYQMSDSVGRGHELEATI